MLIESSALHLGDANATNSALKKTGKLSRGAPRCMVCPHSSRNQCSTFFSTVQSQTAKHMALCMQACERNCGRRRSSSQPSICLPSNVNLQGFQTPSPTSKENGNWCKLHVFLTSQLPVESDVAADMPSKGAVPLVLSYWRSVPDRSSRRYRSIFWSVTTT